MNNTLTDITLVVDRSGSMESCREEAQKGINAFIEEQKKATGKAVFSLLQFDTQKNWVFKGKDIKDVTGYELVPRGMTALLDAVGEAINLTGERLEAMPEEERPGLVIIAVVTDGLENSSSEFTLAQIKSMIERQTNEYSWKFTYLGANQDAFAEGRGLGFAPASILHYNTDKSVSAYSALSFTIANARSAVASGATVSFEYSEEDRKKVE